MDTEHRESENLHTSRCSWEFPTMWWAPLVALGLEYIRQIWCYVAMNRSCFHPYFLPDAGKMSHVQTTVQVWNSWIYMHQHSGQRGLEWRGESSCRRILDLTFNGYFKTYNAGIISFYFHQNNGCIGFIILQNMHINTIPSSSFYTVYCQRYSDYMTFVDRWWPSWIFPWKSGRKKWKQFFQS